MGARSAPTLTLVKRQLFNTGLSSTVHAWNHHGQTRSLSLKIWQQNISGYTRFRGDPHTGLGQQEETDRHDDYSLYSWLFHIWMGTLTSGIRSIGLGSSWHWCNASSLIRASVRYPHDCYDRVYSFLKCTPSPLLASETAAERQGSYAPRLASSRVQAPGVYLYEITVPRSKGALL